MTIANIFSMYFTVSLASLLDFSEYSMILTLFNFLGAYPCLVVDHEVAAL